MNTIVTQEKQKNTRLLALDAARGLAVIGMYVQHFALNSRNAGIVSGNTMILFILCSGISFTLMTEGAKRKEMRAESFRAKVLARAVFIDILGYLIIMLNGPFGPVLTAYAGLFVVALLFRNITDKKLICMSGILFLLCPVIMICGLSYLRNAAVLADLAGGPLSTVGMLPVFILGMFLGRKNLSDIKSAIQFIIIGIMLVVATKMTAAFILPTICQKVENAMLTLPVYTNYVEIDEYAMWPKNCIPVQWNMLFISAPQSGTTVVLLLGTGVALLVLGACILIEKRWRKLLIPFSMVGQVALTLYTIQFVLAWLLELAVIPYEFGTYFFGDVGVAVVVTLLGCLLVKLPLQWIEGIMRKIENRVV